MNFPILFNILNEINELKKVLNALNLNFKLENQIKIQ